MYELLFASVWLTTLNQAESQLLQVFKPMVLRVIIKIWHCPLSIISYIIAKCISQFVDLESL